jgi:hypothetical protein
LPPTFHVHADRVDAFRLAAVRTVRGIAHLNAPDRSASARNLRADVELRSSGTSSVRRHAHRFAPKFHLKPMTPSIHLQKPAPEVDRDNAPSLDFAHPEEPTTREQLATSPLLAAFCGPHSMKGPHP